MSERIICRQANRMQEQGLSRTAIYMKTYRKLPGIISQNPTNVSFCPTNVPQRKHIQFTVTCDEEQRPTVTFEMLEQIIFGISA